MIRLFALLTLVLGAVGVAANAEDTVSAGADRMMADARALRPLTESPEELAAQDAAAALASAVNYAAADEPVVRHLACKLAACALSASDDQTQRRAAVALLTAAMQDPQELVWQHAAAELQRRAAASDFSNESRAVLKEMLMADSPRREAARLVGLAGMAEMKPRLRALLIDESKYETGEHAGKWYGTVSWSARLALARMGGEHHIDRCIALIEAEPNAIIRVTVLLKDLAYIKRAKAFSALKQYLNSEARLPTTKVGVGGTEYSQYAVHILAGAIDDFPIAEKYVGAYSGADIIAAKKWMQDRY